MVGAAEVSSWQPQPPVGVGWAPPAPVGVGWAPPAPLGVLEDGAEAGADADGLGRAAAPLGAQRAAFTQRASPVHLPSSQVPNTISLMRRRSRSSTTHKAASMHSAALPQRYWSQRR